jgi:hypothetical protein
LVVVQTPTPVAQLFAARRYLPLGVPLVKYILAFPGQTLCRSGLLITVDGDAMGDALERDRLGRALPDWQGCRVIGPSEVFLMNRTPPDSLDGRYFGPVETVCQALVGNYREEHIFALTQALELYEVYQSSSPCTAAASVLSHLSSTTSVLISSSVNLGYLASTLASSSSSRALSRPRVSACLSSRSR